MATQPIPPAPKPHDPAPPPKPNPSPKPNDEAAKAHPPLRTIAEYPEPEPVRTISAEQRERSAEIEREGIEKWKAARDERSPDDKPRQVPGINPRQNEPGGVQSEGWEGSTRSTPEARKAQNRTAP